MLKKWADYLVDLGGKPLNLKIIRSNENNITEGKLISEKGRIYSIKEGIPRFVLENEKEISKEISKDILQTKKSFGNKWREEANRNLGKTEEEIKIFEEQFIAMLGANNKTELIELFKDGMNCLNAGCGTALDEYLFNYNKNVNRFAIDVSLSVEVAYDKTKEMDNVFIAQADIFKLPFKKNFFDIIFSMGVLHHTGNAERAFDTLCGHLKPGGIIGIYIYCVKPFIRELADKEIRKITTGMDFNECLEFSKQMMQLGKSLQEFKEPLIINEDIPLLGIKKGEYNLQKFIFDHFVKCYNNSELNEKISDLINLDWYHPKCATHHTKEEVLEWFKKNKIRDVKFVQPKGWEHSGFFVSGRKSK